MFFLLFFKIHSFNKKIHFINLILNINWIYQKIYINTSKLINHFLFN